MEKLLAATNSSSPLDMVKQNWQLIAIGVLVLLVIILIIVVAVKNSTLSDLEAKSGKKEGMQDYLKQFMNKIFP